jgi:hypothetical protein
MIDSVAIVSKRSTKVDQLNLNGIWRLHLIADRTGDGVSYFNTTASWQVLDTDIKRFNSQGVVGFLSMLERGGLEYEKEKRILRYSSVESVGGGGMLVSSLGPQGGAASNKVAQQIMTVDSVLLVTR